MRRVLRLDRAASAANHDEEEALMAASSDAIDLLVIIDEFALGGVASLYSTIVRAASARKMNVAVVGLSGPAHGQLDWAAARTVQFSSWDGAAALTVQTMVQRSRRVVWAACPRTLPIFLSVLTHPRMSYVIHGPAELTSAWLGDEGVCALAAALVARPSIAVMAPSPVLVDELSNLLSIPTNRFQVLTHVSAQGSRTRSTPRPRPRVVAPTRLSAEKRFVIVAAHELARARGLPLTVVGDGDDSAWVEQLRSQSDVEVELILDPEIHDHIADDDVVVAVGLVALEAARYCGAVVTASRARGGCLTAVVVPPTVARLHESNFLGGERGIDPDDAWRIIDGHTDEDRLQVQGRLAALADPDRACDQVLSACDADLGVVVDDRMPAVLTATAQAWAGRASADQRWIDELVSGREWLLQHRKELEAWVAELERGIAFHRDRAASLEQQARDERRRSH